VCQRTTTWGASADAQKAVGARKVVAMKALGAFTLTGGEVVSGPAAGG